MKNNKTNTDSKWPYSYKRYLQYNKHTYKYQARRKIRKSTRKTFYSKPASLKCSKNGPQDLYKDRVSIEVLM